ncbi:unnamed protein product [Vicia faba]|uniref:Uncharacterized protein n=1 Tax=Vicia faba TaxID=3906 RepID=A0AAV0Z985_VICFA|nr:unnamed protein product [Vicia faba]
MFKNSTWAMMGGCSSKCAIGLMKERNKPGPTNEESYLTQVTLPYLYHTLISNHRSTICNRLRRVIIQHASSFPTISRNGKNDEETKEIEAYLSETLRRCSDAVKAIRKPKDNLQKCRPGMVPSLVADERLNEG